MSVMKHLLLASCSSTFHEVLSGPVLLLLSHRLSKCQQQPVELPEYQDPPQRFWQPLQLQAGDKLPFRYPCRLLRCVGRQVEEHLVNEALSACAPYR